MYGVYISNRAYGVYISKQCMVCILVTERMVCILVTKRMVCIQTVYLCEHGLAVLGDHGALVTVQGHKVTVEGLLGVLEHVEQLSGAPFEDTPEVARDQGPANGCAEHNMGSTPSHPTRP